MAEYIRFSKAFDSFNYYSRSKVELTRMAGSLKACLRPRPALVSSRKTRKRGKKTKKKKTNKAHLRFESTDAEESISATLPLSVPVSLAGGSVESDNGWYNYRTIKKEKEL